MITCSGGTLHLQPPTPAPYTPPAGDKLEEVERHHILSVLERTGWRVDGRNGAAEILGLKRTTLQAKMKKLGIRRPTG
jgi:transcriptional regulator with GAF, ATPase, and Fis domain